MTAMETFDVIVIGMGAHGSAALWHLSRTGRKIAGIDRFNPPHRRGSSHGQSRIIRQAYHENPLYVPLVKAAYPLWAELSELAGKPLFQKTGGLFLGAKDSIVVSGAKRSAETYDIPFDYLDAAAIYRRFPVFRPGRDIAGVYEHDAGILLPEEAIAAELKIAAANGAMKGVMTFTNDKLVSSDLNHDPHSCTILLDQTKVIDGNFVNILGWYDNEWGFSNRMCDVTAALAKTL